MIVGSDERLVDLDGVGDRLAEAVSVHRHDESDSHKVLKRGECRVWGPWGGGDSRGYLKERKSNSIDVLHNKLST